MSAPTDRGGRAHDPEIIADVREQLERGSLRFTGENPAHSVNALVLPSLCDGCGREVDDVETCSCGLEVCEGCIDRKHYQCNDLGGADS